MKTRSLCAVGVALASLTVGCANAATAATPSDPSPNADGSRVVFTNKTAEVGKPSILKVWSYAEGEGQAHFLMPGDTYTWTGNQPTSSGEGNQPNREGAFDVRLVIQAGSREHAQGIAVHHQWGQSFNRIYRFNGPADEKSIQQIENWGTDTWRGEDGNQFIRATNNGDSGGFHETKLDYFRAYNMVDRSEYVNPVLSKVTFRNQSDTIINAFGRPHGKGDVSTQVEATNGEGWSFGRRMEPVTTPERKDLNPTMRFEMSLPGEKPGKMRLVEDARPTVAWDSTDRLAFKEGQDVLRCVVGDLHYTVSRGPSADGCARFTITVTNRWDPVS